MNPWAQLVVPKCKCLIIWPKIILYSSADMLLLNIICDQVFLSQNASVENNLPINYSPELCLKKCLYVDLFQTVLR